MSQIKKQAQANIEYLKINPYALNTSNIWSNGYEAYQFNQYSSDYGIHLHTWPLPTQSVYISKSEFEKQFHKASEVECAAYYEQILVTSYDRKAEE